MSRRGFMLLEILLAVSAAVLVAVAGYALLGRVSDRVARAERVIEAGDLASSALAMMEAGLATPENLHGSLHGRVISLDGIDAGVLVRDPVYRLEVATTPSAFAGLVQVDVSVLPADERSEAVLFRASQLMPSGGGA